MRWERKDETYFSLKIYWSDLFKCTIPGYVPQRICYWEQISLPRRNVDLYTSVEFIRLQSLLLITKNVDVNSLVKQILRLLRPNYILLFRRFCKKYTRSKVGRRKVSFHSTVYRLPKWKNQSTFWCLVKVYLSRESVYIELSLRYSK